MDIQTNIDMLTQADYKDWNHYDIQEKVQKLRLKLERIKELEKNPQLLTHKINEDIERCLIEGR